MPCCAVQICGNRSGKANFSTCGVTYHIFPKDHTLKEKWIEACGRNFDWYPTPYSAVCSSHFEEDCFQPTTRTRRLMPGSLPTLKLRFVFVTDSTSTSKQIIHNKKAILKPDQKLSTLKRYKVQLEKYKKMVHHHKQHLRKLQRKVIRYRNRYESINNVLKALKNENAISEEHSWLLEADGEQFLISEQEIE